MRDRRWAASTVLLLVSLTGRLSAQEPTLWHDPSPHTVRFVNVDDNVKLEVLDWGGSGRPLVLLAGGGNTAHVFDDFAPKLNSNYHVYGVTRRGFGTSSAPVPAKSNYSADRLGDDVLAVLDALKLSHPVLAGHSAAGEELSSIGSRHPERVAGLIYLDAAYGYAYYDSAEGFFPIDLQEVKTKLDQLGPLNLPDKKELVRSLLQEDLPRIERDLGQLEKSISVVPSPVPPPAPGAADLASFAAFRSYQMRTQGITVPEAELRQTYESRPDGSVGKQRNYLTVLEAMLNQGQKYTSIRVPVLAIYADPKNWGTFKNAEEREANEAYDKAATDALAKAFEAGVPSARVVLLPHANHYVYISNEVDVLREMRAFLAGLH